MLSMTNTSTITRSVVVGSKRNNVLPHRFPNLFLVFENCVFTFMDAICKNYHGALWDFIELSNGGFYMAPKLDTQAKIVMPFGNDFEGEMSWDAAGLIVTLLTYGRLSEIHAGLAANYHKLYDYIDQHSEARLIYRAID